MGTPELNSFSQVANIIIQEYERYLPTAFDDSLTMLEKVNKVIQQLNDVGKLTNDVVTKWNEVMVWIVNDGINEKVATRLDEMVTDGTFDTIINQNVLSDHSTRIGTLETDMTNIKASEQSTSTEITNARGIYATLQEKLNSMFINVKEFGAKGDGITDDTLFIQNALDSFVNKKGTLYFPYGVYRITNTLNIDVNRVKIYMDGGEILSDGADPSIKLINNFTYTDANEQWGGVYGSSHMGFHGLKLKWKSGIGARGLLLQGVTPEQAIAQVQFMNTFIEGFPICIDSYSQSWNCVFNGGAIRGDVCLNIANGGENYYERFDFIGVTFGSYGGKPSTAMKVYAPNGMVTVDSCSFDYNNVFIDVQNGSRVFVNKTHFETNQYNDYWFKLNGDGAMLTIKDCTLAGQGVMTKPLFYVDDSVAEGGLIFKDSFLIAPLSQNYQDTYFAYELITANRNVMVENIRGWKQGYPINMSLAVNRVPDWYMQGVRGATLTSGVALSTENNHSGTDTKALKFLSTGGEVQRASWEIVGDFASKLTTLTLWTFVPTGQPMYALIECMTSNGDIIETFNQTIQGTSGWQFASLNTVISVPAGTNKMKLKFDYYGQTPAYLDHLVWNVF